MAEQYAESVVVPADVLRDFIEYVDGCCRYSPRIWSARRLLLSRVEEALGGALIDGTGSSTKE